jgi:hypothetical protein
VIADAPHAGERLRQIAWRHSALAAISRGELLLGCYLIDTGLMYLISD